MIESSQAKDLGITLCAAEGHIYRVAGGVPAITKALPILFIHGAGGAGWHWDKILPYFAERGYVCYAPDIVGHGDSRANVSGLSVYDYVADMRRFLAHVVRPAHEMHPIVVGHSMGGLIAQKLAETEELRKAVFVTPASPRGIRLRRGVGGHISFFEQACAMHALFFGEPFMFEKRTIESVFVDPVGSSDMVELMHKRPFRESLVALKEMYLGEIEVDPTKISCGTAVLCAEKDAIIHPDTQREIARYYDARTLTLHHLGHACIMEAGWQAAAGYLETLIGEAP